MASERQTLFECETCRRLFNDMALFTQHSCAEADSGGYDPETLFEEEVALGLESSSSASASASASTASSTTPTIWSRPATLLLIDLYRTNERLVTEGRLRKKAMWAKISGYMKEKGHHVTASQCEGRWKTLVRGIKNITDHNNKSGNDRKHHPYEDELSFLKERPNITPVFVATSKGEEPEKEEDTPPEADTEQGTTPKRRRVRSSVTDVVEVMQNYIKDQGTRHEEETKRQEAMHNERMGLFRDFLNVLGERAKEK